MNPPVSRATRATYPVPSGRQPPEYPHQRGHAAPVQFGTVSRHSGISEELGPAVYGQYRKADFYHGQNVQYNPASLRRSTVSGVRPTSLDDNQVHNVRQSRDKTLVRPRSVNLSTQKESCYDSAASESKMQSGLKTVRRPRSVTFSLPNENVDSSTATQQRDSRMQQTAEAQDRQSVSPAEKGGYDRARYKLNQSPKQNFYRANPMQQTDTGDYNGRNASYRVACSASNRQKAAAMLQRSEYEVMHPINNDQTSRTPPAYSEAVARLQQRTACRSEYSQNHSTQRDGYEEMQPLHLSNAAPRSSAAATRQNAEYGNISAGIQQNGIYSTAPSQQYRPYSTVATPQENGIYSHIAPSQSLPYGRATTQQNQPPYSMAATQQNGICLNPLYSTSVGHQCSPYSTAAGHQNPQYSTSVGHQNPSYSTSAGHQNPSYSTSAGHQNPPYSTSAGHQNPPYSASAGHQNPLYSTSAGHQNPPYSTSAGHQNLPYSTEAGYQNPPRSTAVSHQSTPYSTAPPQQNGSLSRTAVHESPPYSTATSLHNGVYNRGTTQQNRPYCTATTQQNGTYYNPQHNAKNGSYGHATNQLNGIYECMERQQNPPYSTASAKQNGFQNHVTSQKSESYYSRDAVHQNGVFNNPETLQNGTHSNGIHEHQPDNGYDGYDSSDSEFDDSENDHAYDYVNLKEWTGAEHGTTNSATDQDVYIEQCDR